MGRTILRLALPTAGGIVLEGKDITDLPQSELRPMRARMQMIFQDPSSSLSPRMKVSTQLLEPFQIHGVGVDCPNKVDELLVMVGLSTRWCTPGSSHPVPLKSREPEVLASLMNNRTTLMTTVETPSSMVQMSPSGPVLAKVPLPYAHVLHAVWGAAWFADQLTTAGVTCRWPYRRPVGHMRCGSSTSLHPH